MAIFRQIKENKSTNKWAYVEWSDENQNHFIILGGKHFETSEEAEVYSRGFSTESYEWRTPLEIKINRLNTEKEKLEKRLTEIKTELNDSI